MGTPVPVPPGAIMLVHGILRGDHIQCAPQVRKHARFEMAFAFLDGAFDVEGAHNAIFGGGDGQIYKGGGMVIVRKGVFTLKEALLAFSTPGGWFVGIAIETAIIHDFDGG